MKYISRLNIMLIVLLGTLCLISYNSAIERFESFDVKRFGEGEVLLAQAKSLDGEKWELDFLSDNCNIKVYVDSLTSIPRQGQYYSLGSTDLKSVVEVENLSYRNYLMARNYCATGWGRELIGRRKMSSQLGIKDSVKENLFSSLSPQSAAMAMGLLLGEDYYFDESSKESMQKLGLTHIVAVSGANFILVVTVFENSMRMLNPPGRILKISSLLVATGYLLLVGMDNFPALRAFSFFAVEKVLLLMGIPMGGVKKFLSSTILISLISPLFFLDTGFQLSIIAWGVMKIIFSMKSSGFAIEYMSSMIGTVFLFPVTYYFFSEVNLFSPLANLIFVPIFEISSLYSIPVVILSQLKIEIPFIFQGYEFLTKSIFSLVDQVSRFQWYSDELVLVVSSIVFMVLIKRFRNIFLKQKRSEYII